jgi:bifunctional non-homologous end joining protein LigD
VFVGDLPAQGALFDQAAVGAQLEGFVAKRCDSPYVPGVRSRDWLKIKRPGWQEGRTWRK